MSLITLPNDIYIYLKYMNNIKSCSEKTASAYELDLNQAFGELFEKKGKNEKDVQVKIQVEELFKQAKKAQIQWGSLSKSSRNRKAATLKSFFQYLFKEGQSEINYAEQIYCPQVPRKLPHFLSLDEALSVLKVAQNSSPTQLNLFLLLYGCGLRISEACHLKWQNVDLKSRTLRIKGKGQKERIVIMPLLTQQSLSMLSKTNGEFVWGENPILERHGYQIIKDLGKAANLMAPLHPHALRHSFATHILSSGANLRVLQSLLGHESLIATEKYTHVDLQHLQSTIAQHHPLNKK